MLLRKIIVPLAFLLASLHASAREGDSLYLFAYFMENGQDGLHLAWSEDGLKWEALNNNQSFLKPEVGKDKLMRDPCIIQTPDRMFHMVWTVSWGEKGIGYARSTDLVHWSEQQYIQVMEHEKEAMNCWAPEIFFDEDRGEFMIFWSTTIPGRFPETDGTGNGKLNHRMYYVTSRDMQDFSETRLLYDPGFNSIDGTLLKQGDRYLMFLKDETARPLAQKNIRIATAAKPTGPWSPASEPIYNKDWAEGPTIARVGNRWILYFDRYVSQAFGAMASSDLDHWEDISEYLQFPDGVRHGTILKISRATLENLKKPEARFADRWEYAGIAVEEPGYTVWGSSPIQDKEGQTHLFVARWPGELKVDPGWRSHSEIAHYVGPSPEGPFHFSDLALTGSGKETWDKYGAHNPALLCHPNGKYYLYFKSEGGKMGLATAEQLEGPYVQLSEPVTANEQTIEDGYAFIYRDKICLLTTDNHGILEKGGGLLWESEDGLNFYLAGQGFYPAEKYLGKKALQEAKQHYGGKIIKFERPQVLMIDAEPAYLYVTSGYHFFGKESTASYVMRFTNGKTH